MFLFTDVVVICDHYSDIRKMEHEKLEKYRGAGGSEKSSDKSYIPSSNLTFFLTKNIKLACR